MSDGQYSLYLLEQSAKKVESTLRSKKPEILCRNGEDELLKDGSPIAQPRDPVFWLDNLVDGGYGYTEDGGGNFGRFRWLQYQQTNPFIKTVISQRDLSPPNSAAAATRPKICRQVLYR